MRFGFWEILLIVLLVFLLFGANKFPAMMKNLAEGVKVFKKEIKTTDKKPVKKSPRKTSMNKATKKNTTKK
jgi:sec-independent protein translocase protein TatA